MKKLPSGITSVKGLHGAQVGQLAAILFTFHVNWGSNNRLHWCLGWLVNKPEETLGKKRGVEYGPVQGCCRWRTVLSGYSKPSATTRLAGETMTSMKRVIPRGLPHLSARLTESGGLVSRGWSLSLSWTGQLISSRSDFSISNANFTCTTRPGLKS